MKETVDHSNNFTDSNDGPHNAGSSTTAALAADGSTAPYRRPDEARVFEEYAAIIRRLRGPDGCPWDRKQTLQSLRRYIVEEAFEIVAAIDDAMRDNGDGTDGSHSGPGNAGNADNADGTDGGSSGDHRGKTFHAVGEELGDILLVSLLVSDALEAVSGLRLEDVLAENGEKLIRRHPHVFASVEVQDADEVVQNWNQIKTEQEGRSSSVAHVSAGLPPLERAYEIQKKAAKQGFDWPEVGPVLDKVEEELRELRHALADAEKHGRRVKDDAQVEDEVGDLLFSAVNVARHVKTDPSVALHRTNRKFLKRFSHIEAELRRTGADLSSSSLEELDALWEQAKER